MRRTSVELVIKAAGVVLVWVLYAFLCQWFGLGFRFAEGSLFGFLVGYAVYAFTQGRKVIPYARCAEEDSREEKEKEKAVTQALEAINDFPDDPEGHHDLGRLYEEEGILNIAS
jgi:hypothetical protein